VLPTIDIRQIRGPDGTVRVLLAGELDIAVTQRLARWLHGLVERQADIVVDLRDVASIDVSCIRVLLGVAERARAGGSSFAITNAPPSVLRILSLTGALDVLSLEPATA
jgi:anti-sigma B factor antagonist